MSRRRVLGCAAAMALLLAGCSSGSSVDTGGTSQGASQGVLVAGIGGEPDQLDPQKTSSYFSFEVLENVFDTLVAPDDKLEMKPALAESWTTSSDQLTWTFKLRSGVKFHDGSPLTGADVVYSYRRIIDDKLPNAYRFATVSDVAAPDDSTVVIKVKSPTPNLLSNIGSFKGMAIVQKKNVDDGSIGRKPVGTGPFVVESVTSGDSIVLKANPDYWGGAPKLAGVTFKFLPEPTVALTNLQGGQIQWTDNLPPQQVESLRSDRSLVVSSVPSNDYWYVAANQKRAPYGDARVRQAISYAIDRDAITKAAKFGNATVNQTAIPSTSSWYTEYAPYGRDVARAKDLLTQAGVTNLTMDLMVTNQYPETVTAAQAIASQLKDVGVTVKIRTLDFAAWLDEQSKGNFDAFLLGWLGNIDPDDFYYAQHRTGGSFNFQKYSNPEVDKLLDAGRTETDQATRKSLYADAAKRIVDDASYIYLYNPNVVQGWSPNLQGYQARGDRAVRFATASLRS